MLSPYYWQNPSIGEDVVAKIKKGYAKKFSSYRIEEISLNNHEKLTSFFNGLLHHMFDMQEIIKFSEEQKQYLLDFIAGSFLSMLHSRNTEAKLVPLPTFDRGKPKRALYFACSDKALNELHIVTIVLKRMYVAQSSATHLYNALSFDGLKAYLIINDRHARSAPC